MQEEGAAGGGRGSFGNGGPPTSGLGSHANYRHQHTRFDFEPLSKLHRDDDPKNLPHDPHPHPQNHGGSHSWNRLRRPNLEVYI